MNDPTLTPAIDSNLHRLLLALSDALRPITDPIEVQYKACQILGEYLDAEQVTYAEVDSSDYFNIDITYHKPGVMALTGRFPVDSFGPSLMSLLRKGECVDISDISNQAILNEEELQAYKDINVRSYIAAPVIKGGQLVAVLGVHGNTVRNWQDIDKLLVEKVAERTWEAVARARIQQELKASEAKYRSLFDSLDQGFCTIEVIFDEHDAPVDYVFLETNDAFVSQTGLMDAIGKRISDLAPAHERFWFETYGRIAKSGIPERFEHRADALNRWYEVYAFRIGKPGENQLAILFNDVLERKRSEAALREADLRKDEFLAMLAHELRNPLAPIAAATQIMALSDYEESRVRKSTQIIERQVKHMVGLVDDLLDVSRVTRGLVEVDKTPQDIKAVITSSIEQVRPLLEAKHHHLRLQLDAEPTYVLGDHKRLVQVVSNVLNNSAKYTQDRGKIDIETKVVDQSVIIAISDNGIGISPEDQEAIFELFIQAKRSSARSQGGLGIGLALVRTMLKLHDGTIACESKGLGFGSRFVITLPLMPANQQDDEHIVPLDILGQDPLSILVVDDNVDAATSLAELLSLSGHNVTVSHEPWDALNIIDELLPDICILDIGLPKMDGNELARRIRSKPSMKNATLIAVTGYGQESDRQTAMESGFDNHLAKPVDYQKLTSLIQAVSEH